MTSTVLQRITHVVPNSAFSFKDRGETLEYQRGDDLFRFDVTSSLHVRLYADADLATAAGRRVSGSERIAVIEEVLRFMQTQTLDRIEVVGEPTLGDEVRYTIHELDSHTHSPNNFHRNSAIHELQYLGGDDTARIWYRILREDPDSLCVSSAFGLLLQYACGDDSRHRDVRIELAHTKPGIARDAAMKRLDDALAECDPGLPGRLRV